MAQSKTQKKIMNMVYGLGASVVIIGALFKLLHWEVSLGSIKLGGGALLATGLITEALIFAIAAFEPVAEEAKKYEWERVFPELDGGEPRQLNFAGGGAAPQFAYDDAEGQIIRESLSEKLDNILREAKIDAELMTSLATSIRNFEGAARNIGPAADAVASTQKYGEELTTAAVHLEALNSLYRIQLERTELQVNAQEGMVDNLNSLNAQVNSFKEHLKSLNTVYGGMLSAMGGAR